MWYIITQLHRANDTAVRCFRHHVHIARVVRPVRSGTGGGESALLCLLSLDKLFCQAMAPDGVTHIVGAILDEDQLSFASTVATSKENLTEWYRAVTVRCAVSS